jgi:hypothetical protein
MIINWTSDPWSLVANLTATWVWGLNEGGGLNDGGGTEYIVIYRRRRRSP